MNVEPTCRFCKQRMAPLTPFQLGGVGTVYSFLCQRCNSEQLFDTNARLLESNFKVGEYTLDFHHYGDRTHKFQVSKDAKIVFQLEFIPHNITPKNTTEDRIKILILFS